MNKQTVISAKHLKKSFGIKENVQIIYSDFIAALLIVVIVSTSIIFIFASISAMKIHKLEPIDAIRGITGKGNTGQNILLSVLSVGIMVLLSFAGILLYNVSVKPSSS